MHCSSSPSHSTASGWTDSAGSKAIITHGLSEGSRKPPGSHPSMSQWAAATAFRYRQLSDGLLVRGNDARFQDAGAVRMREHLQPPRIVRPPEWRGGREPTRRRDDGRLRHLEAGLEAFVLRGLAHRPEERQGQGDDELGDGLGHGAQSTSDRSCLHVGPAPYPGPSATVVRPTRFPPG